MNETATHGFNAQFDQNVFSVSERRCARRQGHWSDICDMLICVLHGYNMKAVVFCQNCLCYEILWNLWNFYASHICSSTLWKSQCQTVRFSLHAPILMQSGVIHMISIHSYSYSYFSFEYSVIWIPRVSTLRIIRLLEWSLISTFRIFEKSNISTFQIILM